MAGEDREGCFVLGAPRNPAPPPERPRIPVIPIVFLPGIMGSNLRVKPARVAEVKRRFEQEGQGKAFTPEAWKPPAVRYSAAKAVASLLQEMTGFNCQAVRTARAWENFGPKLRQVLLNPATVEVDHPGFVPHFIPGLVFMDGRLAPKMARERGWGEVYWDSYWQLLRYLELNLNPWFGQDPASIHSKRNHVQTAVLISDSHPRLDGVRPTAEEVERAVRFRFPVHAMGYNWAQSNQESADEVMERIEACVQRYQDQGHPCQHVILVTHSMGGLVARRVSQLDQDRKKVVLGVVHGVMPATGAPVAYRRMVGGTEHDSPFILRELRGAFASLAGRTAAETTPVMANAPGALELLPSHLYPPGWLKVECDLGDGKAETLHSFPAPESRDPYTEIYKQKEAWWRMVDPVLLDPAGIGGKIDRDYSSERAWTRFIQRINKVQQFHKDCLSESHYHKSTHYFYAERIRTFSSVRWRLPSHASRFDREAILDGRPGQGDGLGSSEILVTLHDAMTGKVVDGNVYFGSKCRVPAVLQGPDGAGDGTVPVESGKAPSTCIPHGIAADEHRFDHEAAYKEILTQVYTLLAICKLAGTPTP